jgi:hypothetical protein
MLSDSTEIGVRSRRASRPRSMNGNDPPATSLCRPGLRNFAYLPDTDPDDPVFNALRRNELIGRSLSAPDFLDAVSRQLNRAVTPSKRGRKPKAARP